MMLAKDRRGGERTRRSTVRSPLLPDRDDVLVPSYFCLAPPTATAVIGGRHRSLIIVPFLQTDVAVIVLVLLLPPEKMPIPDRDSRPRRKTYDNDGRQHRRRDSRHVRRPLEVACMRTSVLPSFYALFDFSPVGIAMIVQPRCRRSDSPHPRPIPIPMGGTPRPPRGQIPPSPFRGGTRHQSLSSSSSPPSSSSS
jgi:hypothetical protein